jgi:hypothetical protein
LKTIIACALRDSDESTFEYEVIKAAAMRNARMMADMFGMGVPSLVQASRANRRIAALSGNIRARQMTF